MLIGEAVGDEFDYLEFNSLHEPDARKIGGLGDNPEEIIEVYETAERDEMSDLMTLTKFDRIRVIERDFPMEIAAAIADLFESATITRGFDRGDGDARHLVNIAQNPNIFASRVVVPTVRVASSDFMFEKLMFVNPPPIPSARINRRKITPHIDTEKSVQFPSRIIAFRKDGDRLQTIFIAPNTSVIIDEITSYDPRGPLMRDQIFMRGLPYYSLNFDAHGIQEEYRDTPPMTAGKEHPRIISADDTAMIKRAIMETRALFEQCRGARPLAHPDKIAPASDFASTNAENIILPAEYERVARAFNLESFAAALDLTYSTNAISVMDIEQYWILRYSHAPTECVIDNIRENMAAQSQIRTSIREYNESHARLSILSSLINAHLGAAKLPFALASEYDAGFSGVLRTLTVSAHNEEALFAKLTARERELILAQYAQFTVRQIKNERCKHSAVVSNIRATLNPRKLTALLNDIAEFMPRNADMTAMIVCKRCGQNLICPHELEIARANADNKSRLDKRGIVTRYISAIPERRLYFCRICGAIFPWNIVNEDDDEFASSENETLINMVFREVLLTQRNAHPRNMIDPIIFARIITRHIYPFIEAITDKLSRAQSYSAAEFTAKTRVFIAIYAFADIIVNREKMDIIFDGISVGSATGSRADAMLIKWAIDRILIIENVTLRDAPSLVRDVISANIITAVAQMRAVVLNQPQMRETVRDYRDDKMYDPDYITMFYTFSHHCRIKSSRPRHEVCIYETLPPTPTSDPLSALLPTRAGRNRDDAAMRLSSRGRELREYKHAIDTSNHEIVEWRNEFRALCDAMKSAETSIIRREFRPRVNITGDDIYPRAITPDLALLYDEEGRKHIWNIAIFKSLVTGELREYNSRDFKPRADELFVDLKCSVCSKTRADALGGDVSVIQSKIAVRDRQESIGRYFAIRCPLGGNHEWHGSECAKCGFARVWASDSARDAYYGKYSAEFDKATAPAPPIIEIQTSATLYNPAAIEWIPNFSVIADTAAVFKINKVDILSLGAHEGITAAQLDDESFVARVPRTRYDNRIQMIKHYIFDVITKYEFVRLRVGNREKIRSPTMLMFIENLRARTAKGSDGGGGAPNRPIIEILAGIFPTATSINAFANTISDYIALSKPREIIEFLTEVLCRLLLIINDTYSAFAKTAIDAIIANERITMKVDFLTVISDLKALEISDEPDNATGDDYGNGADDEDTNPFSTEVFDIDNDLRGDDEDDEQLIHIGDEVGW